LASRRAGRWVDRDAARYLLPRLLLAVNGVAVRRRTDELAWVAAIALLVLLEKTTPWGVQISLLTGALLIEWGFISVIRAGFAA